MIKLRIFSSMLILIFLAGCQTHSTARTEGVKPPVALDSRVGGDVTTETLAKVNAPVSEPVKDLPLVEQKIEGEKSEHVEEVAVIEMDKGTIVFKFYPEDAPKSVENFRKLAKEGFYNGLTWHRVVKEPQSYIVQGGDPTGTGTGGPGYSISDEFNARPHLEGTVAMARTPLPDSAGSQFYICLDALPQLDGKYTVFGQLMDGFEVIHKIEQGDVMKSVRIEERMVSK